MSHPDGKYFFFSISVLACSRMTWVIVGLGNPGEEYALMRHNAGRMAAEAYAKSLGEDDWKEHAKAQATVLSSKIGKSAATLVLPDTYMNKSGNAVGKFVKSAKAAEHMIVLYDDLDLPIGKIKISFDRGSGGHKGIESITRAVKTKKFARIRIGISPATAAGKIRKPLGEKDVEKHILGKFRPAELNELTRVFRRTNEAIECIVQEGVAIAMNRFN